MANPTTNFGWVMPTSTDLVTDLPADFAIFGQAVDTSMAELKGGTTGQVLSKTSNTDMDFTWVTSDDANAIQNTIVDAKGDLIAASGADTPARLAVGNNGETLVADSSTSTGLRYIPATVVSNPVLNSAFQIAQRGTSFSLAAASSFAYTLDRWYTATNANQACVVSRLATGDTTNLPNIQYCLTYQRNSGQTGTGNIPMSQSIETVNSVPFAGKTVTMSFYARKGSNYSPTGSLLYTYLVGGTGTDQNVESGFTGQTNVIDSTATLTTTWQRFAFTGTVGSTITELATRFVFAPTGTAGLNDYYQITGVQIDIGSVALPFRTNGATIQGELAACQRYFQLVTGDAEVLGAFYTTTSVVFSYKCPVEMRTTPTVTYSTTFTNAVDQVGVANRTPTAYSSSYVAKTGLTFFATGTAASTAYNPAIYRGGNHLVSAEL